MQISITANSKTNAPNLEPPAPPERYQGKAGDGPAMTNDIEFLAALARLTITLVLLMSGALTIAAAYCIAINWLDARRGRSAPEIKSCRCTPCQWPDCRYHCVGPD